MQKCQECGLIHPYTPKGKCLVAKAKKLETTDKGKKIVKLISKLSAYLEESNDYENVINKINNLIGE